MQCKLTKCPHASTQPAEGKGSCVTLGVCGVAYLLRRIAKNKGVLRVIEKDNITLQHAIKASMIVMDMKTRRPDGTVEVRWP